MVYAIGRSAAVALDDVERVSGWCWWAGGGCRPPALLEEAEAAEDAAAAEEDEEPRSWRGGSTSSWSHTEWDLFILEGTERGGKERQC